MSSLRWLVSFSLLAFVSSLGVKSQAEEKPAVEVTLADGVTQQAITGRLYVYLTQSNAGEQRNGPNWFDPEPFFRLDVKDFAPGQQRVVDDSAAGFPDVLSKLPAGTYRVQALLDHNFDWADPNQGTGNFYSKEARWQHNPQQPTKLVLTLDQVIGGKDFPKVDHLHEMVLNSELLSKFHQREVEERATVVLPKAYFTDEKKRFPVVYVIPGFSGSHRQGLAYRQPTQAAAGEVDFIRVMLSGQCKWGHHVYANSATNGHAADALVQEMIPLIDRTFRTVAQPTARFVNGHSSGGWSSLWLQVTYPDTFGGVWSTSPDPVDFRDYQQVNLYANPPLSLYVDEQGQRRPIARRGRTPILWYDSFGKMDDVLGRGGQLRSFEAVFSPLDTDGLPRQLWDRRTGRIDPVTAKAWEAYDIHLKIKRNWPQLAPSLAGKLHIITGELDTFYLEGAVRLLGQTLQQLGSDAVVEIVPGASHSSLLTPTLTSRLRHEMSQSYLKHHPPE